MDTPKAITHLGLCAGYGGIELGLHRVIRNLRTVALCEIEAFACANLVAKMEAGLMDAAPIWTNLKSFPWAEFRDRVDILTGGYPCQPFSAAGKRLGTDDPRHLWPFIADGIRILRPKLCFFENVEGHISLGLREVIGDLESIGYKAAWGIFSAAEVGAPHQRKRVFILAHANGDGVSGSRNELDCLSSAGQGRANLEADCINGRLADADNSGSWEDQLLPELRATRVEQSPGGSREGSGSPEKGEIQRWPSRPGQQQYAWEPPRVVANSKHDGLTSCQIGGSTCETISEKQSWEDNSLNIERASCVATTKSDGMGNSECIRIPTSREYRAMDEASGIPADGEGSEPSQADSDASLARSGEAMANPVIVGRRGRSDGDAGGLCGEIQTAGSCGGGTEVLGNAESGWRRESRDKVSERQGHWTARPSRSDEQHSQAQPTLGGDADGSAGGLGYAELCVTCDNRTDELRLLGNGVVPATAERAFRILIEQI